MTINVDPYAPARAAEAPEEPIPAVPAERTAEEKIDDLRNLHVHFVDPRHPGKDICVLCQEAWPCLTIQVIGEK